MIRTSLHFILVIVFSITVVSRCEVRESLEGYQVWRASVQSEKDFKIMESLENLGRFDFWDFPHDVMVSPNDADYVRDLLGENEIKYEIWIKDVQTLIDNQFNIRDGKVKAFSTDPDDVFYTTYHRYSEIDQWIRNMAARYPSIAEEFILGKSYENRVMRALKVGNNSNPSNNRPAMWIHSGIHAREWISPATNMWMTNKMLHDYGTDDLVTRLLDMFDIYIIFSLNPDGYEYTWDVNRLWRKTRSVNLNAEPVCYGVDANRNWAYKFGGGGTSTDPCSIIYRGEYPFSEMEVKHVVDFIAEKSKTQDFKFFMDIHSYSQMFLGPWGYTYDLPKDLADQNVVGKAFVDALRAVHGTEYVYGPVSDVLYVAAGISVDWGYGVAGIKYSFTPELRDTGEYGFVLPEDQILPTAQETYAGMLAVYDIVMNDTLSGKI